MGYSVTLTWGSLHTKLLCSKQKKRKKEKINKKRYRSVPQIRPPAFLAQSTAEVFLSRSPGTTLQSLRLFLFKPLSWLPRTQTARINDGHASYFVEAPCFLAPQR